MDELQTNPGEKDRVQGAKNLWVLLPCSGTTQLLNESPRIPFGLPQKHWMEDTFRRSEVLPWIVPCHIWTSQAITDAFTFTHVTGWTLFESQLRHFMWQFGNLHTPWNKLLAPMNAKWPSSYLSLDPFVEVWSNQSWALLTSVQQKMLIYLPIFIFLAVRLWWSTDFSGAKCQSRSSLRGLATPWLSLCFCAESGKW